MPINIQFTSGTTGAPKGATLTHHNIVNNARAVAQLHAPDRADDALCIPVPLYHCFGMVLAVLACVCSGAKMVFPGEGFDAERHARRRRGRTLHRAAWRADDVHRRARPPGVRAFRPVHAAHRHHGRRPCPIEVMRRVQRDMHMHEVTIAYGMTETSPVSFQSATDDPLDKRVTTVGRVLPHLEVKIVDFDGRTCRWARRASCARAATR